MTAAHPATPAPDAARLISCFPGRDAMRSRSVSEVVLAGRLDVPALPARLTADLARTIALDLRLAPGDVEALSLTRARARWPAFRQCVRAASDWLDAQGLGDVLADGEIALMACRGARYHHDGEAYGGSAFCNLFLSEDQALDVHFPATGRRIPLARGTAMLFDPGQPHGVVPRGTAVFDAADFESDPARMQVFLTWELPVETPRVARALDIGFDLPLPPGIPAGEQRVWRAGVPLHVGPGSGGLLSPTEPDQAIT